MNRNPIEHWHQPTVIHMDVAYLEAYGTYGFCTRSRVHAKSILRDVRESVDRVLGTDFTWHAPEIRPKVTHYSIEKVRHDFARYQAQLQKAPATFPICFYMEPTKSEHSKSITEIVQIHEHAHAFMFERMRKGYDWIFYADTVLGRVVHKCGADPAMVQLKKQLLNLYRRGRRTERTFRMHLIHEVLARIAVLLELDEAEWNYVGFLEMGDQPSQFLVAITTCVKREFGSFTNFVERVDQMVLRYSIR